MRLQTYRVESHSRHFDLVGHWSIDLVSQSVTANSHLSFCPSRQNDDEMMSRQQVAKN